MDWRTPEELQWHNEFILSVQLLPSINKVSSFFFRPEPFVCLWLFGLRECNPGHFFNTGFSWLGIFQSRDPGIYKNGNYKCQFPFQFQIQFIVCLPSTTPEGACWYPCYPKTTILTPGKRREIRIQFMGRSVAIETLGDLTLFQSLLKISMATQAANVTWYRLQRQKI